MKAKKVAIEERAPAAEPVGPGPGPAAAARRRRRPSVQILGEGPEAAAAVVDLLEKLGVLAR